MAGPHQLVGTRGGWSFGHAKVFVFSRYRVLHCVRCYPLLLGRVPFLSSFCPFTCNVYRSFVFRLIIATDESLIRVLLAISMSHRTGYFCGWKFLWFRDLMYFVTILRIKFSRSGRIV